MIDRAFSKESSREELGSILKEVKEYRRNMRLIKRVLSNIEIQVKERREEMR
jgi:hypothetical protein